MRKVEIDLDHVKRLVELVEQYGLAELAVEEEGLSIIVKGAAAPGKEPCPGGHAATVHVAPKAHAAPEAAKPQPAEQDGPGIVTIQSPMVGVFYRSSSPDAPYLVNIGDEVEVGQTVGLIEAMKVFSEIPSEVAGIVVEAPAENGKLVHQGEPLVRIRTL